MSTPETPTTRVRDENAAPQAPGSARVLPRSALIGLLWALLFQGATLVLGYGMFEAARLVLRWMTGTRL